MNELLPLFDPLQELIALFMVSQEIDPGHETLAHVFLNIGAGACARSPFGKFRRSAFERFFEVQLHGFETDRVGVFRLARNHAHAVDEVVVHHIEQQEVLAFGDEELFHPVMMDDVEHCQIFLIGGLGIRLRLVQIISQRQEIHPRRALPLVHQMKADHQEQLADSRTEVRCGISANESRDTAAVFSQFMTAAEVLFPCDSEVFVVADFERMIEPVLENAMIFLLDASSKVAARNIGGAQTPVLLDSCRFDTAAQPQVSDMTESRAEDIRLLGWSVQ